LKCRKKRLLKVEKALAKNCFESLELRVAAVPPLMKEAFTKASAKLKRPENCARTMKCLKIQGKKCSRAVQFSTRETETKILGKVDEPSENGDTPKSGVEVATEVSFKRPAIRGKLERLLKGRRRSRAAPFHTIEPKREENEESSEKSSDEKLDEPKKSPSQHEEVQIHSERVINRRFSRPVEGDSKATISLQHCSFTQASKHVEAVSDANKAEVAERNVRIHFRMTMNPEEKEAVKGVVPIRWQRRKVTQNVRVMKPFSRSESKNSKNEEDSSSEDDDDKDSEEESNDDKQRDENFFRGNNGWKKAKEENIGVIRSVRDNLRMVKSKQKEQQHKAPENFVKLKARKASLPVRKAQEKRGEKQPQKSNNGIKKKRVRENEMKAQRNNSRGTTPKKDDHCIIKQQSESPDSENKENNNSISCWETPKELLDGYQKWWEKLSEDELSEWDRRLIELWWEDVRRRLNIPVPEAILRPIFCFNCCFCREFELPESEWPTFLRMIAPQQFDITIDDWCIEKLIRLQKMIMERVERIQKEEGSCYASSAHIHPLFVRIRNSLKRVNWRQLKQQQNHQPLRKKWRRKWVPRWRNATER
jgi:hypothetical protein